VLSVTNCITPKNQHPSNFWDFLFARTRFENQQPNFDNSDRRRGFAVTIFPDPLAASNNVCINGREPQKLGSVWALGSAPSSRDAADLSRNIPFAQCVILPNFVVLNDQTVRALFSRSTWKSQVVEWSQRGRIAVESKSNHIRIANTPTSLNSASHAFS